MKTTLLNTTLLSSVLFFAFTKDALSAERVAKIIDINGTVQILKYGRTLPTKNNIWLYEKDVVVTKADSSVELQLVDGSLINLGELARISVLDLVYDPLKKDGYIDLKIVKGAFRLISGSIAKLGPDLMQLKIPSATIGSRGTNIVGKIDKIGKKSFVILVPDPDGRIGELVVKNTVGIVVLRKPNDGVTMIYPDKKLAKKKYTEKFIRDLVRQVPKLRHKLHRKQFDSLFWFNGK